MAIVYLVDRGEPENADFFAGQSNGFRVWMERSSVESAERTAREFSEVDLYLVERYKDGWVLRSLRSATPFEGHARRIARQDARMPEAIRNVLSPASPYRPIVHGQSKAAQPAPLDPSKPLEGNAVAYFTVGGDAHDGDPESVSLTKGHVPVQEVMKYLHKRTPDAKAQPGHHPGEILVHDIGWDKKPYSYTTKVQVKSRKR